VSEGCREACLAAAEPLAGSAGAARALVAVSWPKRRWHHDKAARSLGLPPALAELEAREKKSPAKLAVRVFQRGANTDTERVEVLLHRADGVGWRARDVPLDGLVPLIEAGLGGADPGRATEPLGPELLVCTDGRHDECCARFGRPAYRALADEVEKRGLDLGVSECSHLGGHRFAANAIALPGGDLYGRLEPRDAGALVQAVLDGRVLRYRYRGRLGASEIEQAAECFLAARLADGASWQLAGEAEVDGERAGVPARVRDAVGERRALVRLEARPFAGPKSCGEETETRSRWVGVEIEPGA